MVKSPPANPGDIRDSIRSLGQEDPLGGHGNPLQDSYLENPMDGGAQWPSVHGVAQSWTRRKQLSTHGAHSAFNQTWEVDLRISSGTAELKAAPGAVRRRWMCTSGMWTWLTLHVPAEWPCPSSGGRDWSDLAHTPLKYAFAFNPIVSETQLFSKIYYLTWMAFKHRRQGVPTKLFGAVKRVCVTEDHIHSWALRSPTMDF